MINNSPNIEQMRRESENAKNLARIADALERIAAALEPEVNNGTINSLVELNNKNTHTLLAKLVHFTSIK
jgi:hypothetical protein